MEYGNYSTTRHSQREFRPETKKQRTTIMMGTINWAILICTMLLVSFGTVMVFSASYDHYQYHFIINNLMWAAVGAFLMGVLCMQNFNLLNNRRLALFLFVLSIVLLFAVLVAGKVSHGAKRRILGIQPSEFVKLFTIIILAHMLDTNKKYTTTHKGFWTCIIVFVGIPVGLIGLGNASTAIILGVICMAMMIPVVKQWYWFLEVVVLGAAAGIIVLFRGEGFRMGRIEAWLHPFEDTTGKSFQVIHSLYAVASGGLSGLGLGNSREKLSYLPEAHNDMIFSIICEELGLFGAAFLVIMFTVLIFNGFRVALKCYNTFGALVAIGISTMISLQVIVNMGVATNTIPNTGIPMPFISYGGSSMIVNMAAMGILMSISRFFKDTNAVRRDDSDPPRSERLSRR
ncbi:MAG: cell division protein FtsW [Firmicutes bacterium]|nr:cell division protein FtsW [Bacillota bacterium]MBQ9605256.1 cell division protein FtsW [Bacillota bacterium]